MTGEIQAKCGGFILNLLRIVSGFLFMQHGAQKLFGFFGGFGGEPGNTAALFSLMGLAGVLEFFGGIAILLGLFTRQVAFVLSGQMAVAYFMAHVPGGFWPIMNHGELAALYCFLFLFFAAAGGGDFSVDGMRKKGGGQAA
jgi:putative oxidoreductase